MPVFLARCVCACASLFLAADAFGADPAEWDDASWSAESNGLQARLAMRRLSVFNGTAIIATYLELKNVSRASNALLLKEHPLAFTITDDDGHDVPWSGSLSFDGPVDTPPPLVLPHDSWLRFRLGPIAGYGVPGDQAAFLGAAGGRTIPHDGKAYYLQATLKLPPKKNDREGSAVVWHGTLVLPRVRIPTEPDPIDPNSIGPRIEELGPKMLDPKSSVSESAVEELSLIDDPRVIPWYIKAVKSDSYDLRFAALDRLSRMEGDEALEGLKIGMATMGSDMGHSSTKKGADGLAENIRVSAAYALARSPHPLAKSLLWTMERDPLSSVRLIVIQTAAGVDTPEALAIVQRGTKDTVKLVREESNRLLNERRKLK